ncbi:4-alpha-glucanotransferase [Roseomonas elaeocarpi]|uniref:4-alpha-glucanotransferase n=1 Tax=Roseomonas elaeocarpi TaxID=907779 RepID=A0ABV6JS93_9PROT
MSDPSPADRDLLALAEDAGVAAEWQDARGELKRTEPEVIRTVLTALGLPSNDAAAIRDSRERLRQAAELPPLCTAAANRPVLLGVPGTPEFTITQEDGQTVSGRAEREGALLRLAVQLPPGYHRLQLGDRDTTLAVAPDRCFSVADARRRGDRDARPRDNRPWGLSVQLYGLRREGDGGVGDFTALAQFARAAATKGADALAISPVHAQFSADPDRFSPYAPSSRLFLNVLHADPAAALGEVPFRAALTATGLGERYAALQSTELVDWPEVARTRLAIFRSLFDHFTHDADFERFRAEGGEALESHARFEALHAHLIARDPEHWEWRDWPAQFRDPAGPAVAEFARDHAREVGFHVFLQWLADRGLADAQRAATEAGARIGLIADLAVGTDRGGSHSWSRQRETLQGLTVGAPPDIFSPLGQSWGITAFSPLGLKGGGYGAFLEMLRASMRHAGGIRIDHAMGLQRLWVVPDGAEAKDGAYVQFPSDDMFRLVALESQRHEAVVVGEDLGTVPEGFRDRLDNISMLGMRVLWFEQDEDKNFTPPASWSANAAAMTTTHDLPTAAGWWCGNDIDWRAKLHLLGKGNDGSEQREEREHDRENLWRSLLSSGAADGPMPAPDDAATIADAAVAHVGLAACDLALLPMEDALGLVEQPNLPGTTDEHPNWRRRLPAVAAEVLDLPDCDRRLGRFAAGRHGENRT